MEKSNIIPLFNNFLDQSNTKQGYLNKRGQRMKTWKKRWFELDPFTLSYAKSQSVKKQKKKNQKTKKNKKK